MKRAAFAALIVLLAGCERGPAPLVDVAPGSARGANVLLITLDTVRADHLGCYGRTPSVTPNLDRLCAQGVRFDNAVTPAPITLPAHATLLTGLTPPHHGLRYNATFAADKAPATLADDLRGQGYYTAAVVASFVLDRRFGLAHGFEDYDDQVVGKTARGGYVLRNERDADVVTDTALALLAKRDPRKPFFLWAHYYDAHAPYAPRDLSGPDDMHARYAAEIAQVDAAIGRLLAAGALTSGRTLIVVAADHGEALGEHGERTHGLFLYDATTRVPLLLRLPDGQGAGQTVTGLAGLVDVRASVRSLLGLDAIPGDGIDWLRASRANGEGIYQEASLPYFDYGFAPLYAWRGATERFVEAPAPEFYDLAADPHERDDRYAALAGSADTRADRARQRLDALRLNVPTIPAAAATMQNADPAATARLRSLGYLGGGATGVPEGELADPKSQTRLVELHQDAVILLDSGRPQPALALLEQARAQSPRNEGVLRLVSRAQLALGKIDDAEATLKAILAIRPNADSLVLLAQIVVLRQHFADAEALLAQAEALEPKHGGIAVARGDIALRQGDPEGARAQYRQAESIDPARVGDIARQRMAALPAGATDK
ncbi:sulfatase-like hydrolase/transferase [Tahibacter soli]|uniref:Sulfatase-like hydrolase/transferase n=1 Tax=Tahibacter soli TaxID=2983605 RepID=A0A9X4BIY6_9GAMM|nr:sulfatase-like hydrolase/transferase [Tahibacter soli]MDC8012702.1 sulfatase-like hydrolase/transferase [Tahibacter soli]